MRFTESGLSILNVLLDARDAGEVVFLCEAGISIATPFALEPMWHNRASLMASGD